MLASAMAMRLRKTHGSSSGLSARAAFAERVFSAHDHAAANRDPVCANDPNV